MATESTDGPTEENILAIGRTIECMVMDFIPGPMVDFTTESTGRTKRMAMDFSDGQMGKSGKDLGKTESNME